MKFDTLSVVRIDWQDHYTYNANWIPLREALATKPNTAMCSSVGLVVSQDANQIVLAQNWHGAIGMEGEPKCSDFMTIIKGCIRKVTVYRKKEDVK